MSEQNTNGKYVSPFIPDGTTRDAVIPEQPGLWSAVKIRYRPLSIDEQSSIYARQRLSPSEPVARFYAQTLAGSDGAKGNLLDWDLKDEHGHKLVVTAQNIGRLHPVFYEQLIAVIEGSVVLPSGETQREQEVKNS